MLSAIVKTNKMISCLLILGILTLGNAWKTYEGYSVYKVIPRTPEDLRIVAAITTSDVNFDVWKESRRVGDECHILVSQEMSRRLVNKLSHFKLDYDVHIPDVGSRIDALKIGLESRHAFNLNDWNTLDDIMNQLDIWAAACRPEVSCEVVTFGDSYEGRPMKYIKMSSGGDKPTIWIDTLVHSREWLTGATLLYIIDHMVYANETDEDVSRMLDAYDWYFAPVMNPDGYEYTWTDDRFWRKNRQPNEGALCNGTDPNRNFNVTTNGIEQWCSIGASTNPCTQNYCGTYPGSAPESAAHANVLADIPNKLVMVSIHCYSNLWLQPYGHVDEEGVCARSDNYEEMLRVGEATIQAIEETGGQEWTAGPVCETFYAAAGGTCDYAHANLGYAYSYTPELRGETLDPPASEIRPSFEETWAGIVAMADALSSGNGYV